VLIEISGGRFGTLIGGGNAEFKGRFGTDSALRAGFLPVLTVVVVVGVGKRLSLPSSPVLTVVGKRAFPRTASSPMTA
jgi:hypothetical protein